MAYPTRSKEFGGITNIQELFQKLDILDIVFNTGGVL